MGYVETCTLKPMENTMKTFATFAAIAALVSGVSFAHAQGTPQQDEIGAGANSQYCLDVRGDKSCKYETLAACQKDAGSAGICAKNPNFSAMKDDGLKAKALEPKSKPAN